MASPELTSPPGELMYIVIGLSGLSDSSHRSCATMAADTVSSIGPFRHIIRSCERQSMCADEEGYRRPAAAWRICRLRNPVSNRNCSFKGLATYMSAILQTVKLSAEINGRRG